MSPSPLRTRNLNTTYTAQDSQPGVEDSRPVDRSHTCSSTYLKHRFLPTTPHSTAAATPLHDRPQSRVPVASPINIGRKRSNASRLAQSPARLGHIDRMADIFDDSRQAVRSQGQVGRLASHGRLLAGEGNASPSDKTKLDRGTPRPCLPVISSLGRLRDDLPSGLITPSQTVNTTSTQSPVEKWIASLPDRPAPPPNTSRLRAQPTTPGAKAHRMCSSASSIARRIQILSPANRRFASLDQGLDSSDEDLQNPPTRLLAQLLQPPRRSTRVNSNVGTMPVNPRLDHHQEEEEARHQEQAVGGDGFMCRPRSRVSSEESSTSPGSDSDVNIGLPTPRQRQSAPSHPATPASNGVQEIYCDLTPEVELFRKGKRQVHTRCKSYYDRDIIVPSSPSPEDQLP